jgi:hypothetical protein
MKTNPLQQLADLDKQIAALKSQKLELKNRARDDERKNRIRRWIIIGRLMDAYSAKKPDHLVWLNNIIEKGDLSESERKFFGFPPKNGPDGDSDQSQPPSAEKSPV